MALILWDDNYSVNVREIDSQHKKLIAIINELNGSITDGSEKNVIEKILIDLVEYAAFHFSSEEKYFALYNYPKTNSHMQQHTLLIDQLKEYINKYKNGIKDFAPTLLNFLKDWLTNHIVGSDKKYSEYFNKNGIY